MAQRHQRGWLKKEKRTQGETWVLFFRITRKCDGKRVENKIPIGLVQNFPDEHSAWAEVQRLRLPINRIDLRRGLTFGDLAQHYAEHELVEYAESIRPKAHTTIRGYERVLRNRLFPRWGNRIALGIEPLEVEQWLKALKKEELLANPTLDKMRRVMSLVFRHGQRYGLIPRNQESNPMRFVRCKTGDWVFPSFRLDGEQPRVGNMIVEDYLRPAAVKAGILSSHRDGHGRVVDDDSRRFGFHTLHHSLASFLIRIRTDPKTVQTLLRHSDVKLTLQFYTHAVSRDRMAAAGKMLAAILSHATDESGLRAD
jgi:integrase